MPKFYGPKSQTMNVHNLIHIADDVLNLGAPISKFSAFDFENSLGYIKSILKSTNNPISQMNRKLHIFHSNRSTTCSPLMYLICNNIKYSLGKVLESTATKTKFSFVNINNFKISSTHPDNVCLLKDGNIIIVKEICSPKQNSYKTKDIFLKGNLFVHKQDFFNYPISSQKIGIYEISDLNIINNVEMNIILVEAKCILTNIDNKNVAITLLH